MWFIPDLIPSLPPAAATLVTEKMVYIHGNLRLVDKLQGMDYAEELIQWEPGHKEALERLCDGDKLPQAGPRRAPGSPSSSNSPSSPSSSIS